MINYLLGDENISGPDEVNETTGKGRHTTTARELMVLAGGIIIDNPGVREIHMWTDEADAARPICRPRGIGGTMQIADHCRHGPKNAGCAIQSAIAAGALDGKRLDGFPKLDQKSPCSAKTAEAANDHRPPRAPRPAEAIKAASPIGECGSTSRTIDGLLNRGDGEFLNT